MKLNTKRNLILLTLSGLFFLVAKAGFDHLSSPSGFGIPTFVFAGLAFAGTSLALVIRLWGTEQE